MWRGSLGVKILLGFSYASQSQRVLVVCSSRLEGLRCSPPPLAALPAQRHLLIPASSPEPVLAASSSPLPPSVVVGASDGNIFEPRQHEKGILTSLLVSGNSRLPSSYKQVTSITWIVLICQKTKLNASLYAVSFLSCLPSKC